MADLVPASSGRLCGLCGRPHSELFTLLARGELIEACCTCWLTAEIQQLAAELADDELELGLAAEVLEGVYRRLRAKVVALQGRSASL